MFSLSPNLFNLLDLQNNILVDEYGTACLADFGLAHVKYGTTRLLQPTNQPQMGTTRWMAPERLDGRVASRSSDIYSFAMTIYEVTMNSYSN